MWPAVTPKYMGVTQINNCQVEQRLGWSSKHPYLPLVFQQLLRATSLLLQAIKLGAERLSLPQRIAVIGCLTV